MGTDKMVQLSIYSRFASVSANDTYDTSNERLFCQEWDEHVYKNISVIGKQILQKMPEQPFYLFKIVKIMVIVFSVALVLEVNIKLMSIHVEENLSFILVCKLGLHGHF